MPKVNFNTDESEGFGPVPKRWHCARIDSINETATKSGEEMWTLIWVIARGSRAGERIYDNLPFTAKARPKLKALCEALGIDISGEIELTPEDLLRKTCLIEVQTEHTANSGEVQSRATVRFNGYKPLDEGDCSMDEEAEAL